MECFVAAEAEKNAKTGSCMEGEQTQLPTMLLGSLIGQMLWTILDMADVVGAFVLSQAHFGVTCRRQAVLGPESFGPARVHSSALFVSAWPKQRGRR